MLKNSKFLKFFIIYAIFKTPTDNVNEINKRKLRIDQYLQYLHFRVRANLSTIPHVIKLTAKLVQSDVRLFNELKSKIFENAPIRHSFTNEKLFDSWKDAVF